MEERGQLIDLFLKQKSSIFCFKLFMAKHKNSVDSQVFKRVKAHGEGWVFTPAHFLDLGSRTAVGLALMRHRRAGSIRQLARGLYDYPKRSPKFGVVPPADEAVAKALQGRDAARLQLSGVHAANQLGLSEQVPVKTVYLSDSRSRRVKIGRREIVVKRTTPRFMATAGRPSGLVIQALRSLGQRHVDENVIRKLRRSLKREDRVSLIKDAHLAPAWIAAIFHKLAGDRE